MGKLNILYAFLTTITSSYWLYTGYFNLSKESKLKLGSDLYVSKALSYSRWFSSLILAGISLIFLNLLLYDLNSNTNMIYFKAHFMLSIASFITLFILLSGQDECGIIEQHKINKGVPHSGDVLFNIRSKLHNTIFDPRCRDGHGFWAAISVIIMNLSLFLIIKMIGNNKLYISLAILILSTVITGAMGRNVHTKTFQFSENMIFIIYYLTIIIIPFITNKK